MGSHRKVSRRSYGEQRQEPVAFHEAQGRANGSAPALDSPVRAETLAGATFTSHRECSRGRERGDHNCKVVQLASKENDCHPEGLLVDASKEDQDRRVTQRGLDPVRSVHSLCPRRQGEFLAGSPGRSRSIICPMTAKLCSAWSEQTFLDVRFCKISP